MDTNAEISPPPELIQRVLGAFAERFGGEAQLFCAPGRINIIGEHTDYSGGFVLPAAIDRFCIVAVRPNQSDSLRTTSLNHGESADLPRQFKRTGGWIDYVAGVRASLMAAGIETPGCDIVIGGDVPEGAGVSSSAALEVAIAASLLAMADHAASPLEVAKWCQNAENDYVGMPCGIMDQYASVLGIAGHALQIDCRALTHVAVPIPENLAFLVIDSLVRHKLTDGGYAARRADCEAAAAAIGVPMLREADGALLSGTEMDERIRRRALHVVRENERVGRASAALAMNDAVTVGRLMNDSHVSLKSLFEVTCAETDVLASIAADAPGVFGARQMGGGFGGAVIALVEAVAANRARETIINKYQEQTGLVSDGFVCRIAGGVRELTA